MPSGAGRSRRTTPGAIAKLFRAAKAAVTRRDPDTPRPATRRRRGEKEGGGPATPRQVARPAGGPPAFAGAGSARGQYAGLQTKSPKAAALRRGFARTAGEVEIPVEAMAEGYAIQDTLAWSMMWPGEAGGIALDGQFSAPQNRNSPQP